MFRLLSGDKSNSERESNVVIWTTTPWTLPANLALAVHPRERYVEVISSEKSYWVAEELADSFITACGFKHVSLEKELLGIEMTSWVTQHPFIDRRAQLFRLNM